MTEFMTEALRTGVGIDTTGYTTVWGGNKHKRDTSDQDVRASSLKWIKSSQLLLVD